MPKWKSLPYFENQNGNTKEQYNELLKETLISIEFGETGYWLAYVAEDGYQVLVLKNDENKGGNYVYGSDTTLQEIEASLTKKKELIERLPSLQTKQEMDQVMNEWKESGHFYLKVENELWEEFSKGKDEFYKRLQVSREENKQKKLDLIEQAKLLANSIDFKETTVKFQELIAKWKEIPYTTFTQDQALWQQFHEYSDQFFSAKKEHYESIKAQHETNKSLKEAIIEEAKKVVEEFNDIKDSTTKFNDLFAKWKEVGSAGSDEASVWERFDQVRVAFQAKREQAVKVLEEAYLKTKEEKEAIIQKAKELVSLEDYSKEITEKMKELDKVWKNIGSSGREWNETLWNEYQEVKNKFWEVKNLKRQEAQAEFDRKQKEFKDKMSDAIARRQTQIIHLTDEIKYLEKQSGLLSNLNNLENIKKSIEQKKEKINELRASIQDMKSKM